LLFVCRQIILLLQRRHLHQRFKRRLHQLRINLKHKKKLQLSRLKNQPNNQVGRWLFYHVCSKVAYEKLKKWL
jgi:hypothetical protein